MNKKNLLTALAVFMTIGTGTGFAQMMGSGQHMYGGQGTGPGQEMMEGAGQQQDNPQAQQQNYPYQMYPGMMGHGYGGYGMGPGMMGYGGYGMGPGMMGYGRGMQPGMMGGYGYGMGPGMMGYGHGMHPGMMGYGMGPGMMSGYGYGMGPGRMGYGSQEEYKKYQENQVKFLDETKELRRKLHSMKFDFSEEARDPEANREKLQEMEKEMYELHEKIRAKAVQ